MLEVRLPSIGEGIAEGEIVKWLVQVGDQIQAEAPLVEILTDKASVEIPAPSGGVVEKLLFSEGELVPVGQVMLHLQQGQAPIPRPEPVPEPPSSPQRVQESVSEAPSTDAAMATPSVRRYAREQGVNLALVKGTGPYGRIRQEDVEQAAKQPVPISIPISASVPEPVSALLEERIPLRGIRRKIAEQMVKAKFTAPDFLYADEADLTDLVSLRQELSAELKAEGLRLTYLPFVVKAVIAALKKYPTLNASLDDERQEVVLKKEYHIGIATASPNGLYVPVIRHADRLSLLQLSSEIDRLAAAVRDGSIKSEEMRGGTFTITNIGVIGGLISAPIINHPEVAILGFNKIYQKPMVYQDQIAIRWACTLSLSFDHRVVDGAEGAYFTNEIIRQLQNPKRILLGN